MLRHVTSDKVLHHIADRKHPVLQSEVLAWVKGGFKNGKNISILFIDIFLLGAFMSSGHC